MNLQLKTIRRQRNSILVEENKIEEYFCRQKNISALKTGIDKNVEHEKRENKEGLRVGGETNASILFSSGKKKDRQWPTQRTDDYEMRTVENRQ